METRAVSTCHLQFRITLALLLLILGTIVSCKKSPTDPAGVVSISPLPDVPGIQVTNTNDAGLITWLPDGTEIAYNSLARYGPAILGGIKVVNIDSKTARILDDNMQGIWSMDGEGDSLFYNGNGKAGSGFFVVCTSASNAIPAFISGGENGVISPDRAFAACVNLPGDSVQILDLHHLSLQALPIQRSEIPLKFSPDSRQLLLWGGRLITISDGTTSMVPFPVTEIRSLAWNDDGIWALTISSTLTSYSPMTLDVYTLSNLLTGQTKEIWRSTASDMWGSEIAISRDGKRVAFMRCTPMNIVPTIHSLYICDIASGYVSKLLSVPVRIGMGAIPGLDSFAFSPDGKRIAYAVEGNIYYCNL